MKSVERLLVCGDSIMKGVVYDKENQKYRLCESRNFDSLAQQGVEVYNRAAMGATVERGAELLNRLKEKFTARTAVLFGFGGNDCDFAWDQISRCPEGEYAPKVTFRDFIEKYRAIIRRAQEAGLQVLVANLPPIDCHKYFDWITRGLSRENILSWLGDVTMLSRWHERYSDGVCALARETGCTVVDIRTPFLIRRSYGQLLCADGIHPTQAGHDLIERTLCDALWGRPQPEPALPLR